MHPGYTGMLAPGGEIPGKLRMKHNEGGAWGEKGIKFGIMLLSPPSKAAIFSLGELISVTWRSDVIAETSSHHMEIGNPIGTG